MTATSWEWASMKGAAAEEVVFVGGSIYPRAGVAPVEALLIRGDRVAAVGGAADVRARAGAEARIVDLHGSTVTPGFTDSHVHLTSWGLGLRRVDLASSSSIGEVISRVSAASLTGSGWIRGQGWSRAKLERDPRREDLDRIGGDRPILLDSHDLHSAWLNSPALRLLGLDSAPDPPGGRIGRDPATGEPTGILYEAARAAALDRLPGPSEEEVLEALEAAQERMVAWGITGVHSVEATGVRDFGLLLERGELRLRVLQHVQLDQLESAIRVGLRSGFGGGRLRIGGVKMFLDGALGSRTAWLREPYTGTEAERGIRTMPEAEFREAVRLAAANGIAATVHAIGDAAVSLAIEVLGTVPPPPAMPHRIEHLQLCPAEAWEMAGRSGVIASMQPVHLLTDLPLAEDAWGHERCRGAFPFRAVSRAGMVLAFGSDVPVETPDPRPGLSAARRRVTWADYDGRRTGGEEWYPEHALSGAQAVAAYTEGPARAAGAAGQLGTLEVGRLADLSVWSRDPVRIDADEYSGMECRLTMIAGEIVHRMDL